MRSLLFHAAALLVVSGNFSSELAALADKAPEAQQSAPQQSAPLTESQAWTLAVALKKGEADTAKIAVARAQQPAVKAFAEHMLRVHEIANHGDAEAARRLKVHPQGGAQLSQLRAEQRVRAQKLNATPKADFDRAYVDTQMEDDQRALDMLDQDLLPSALTPALSAELQSLHDAFSEHLDEARGVQLQLP